jgi:fumarate reductase flavoprotein subunit
MSSTRTEKVGNLQADIVILGSGSGLVAAVAAAEKGVTSIIVLEKQGSLGGHSKIAQGLFACESPIQKRENIIADRDECFRTFMRWHHWAGVDPRVARAYINKSGDTIRWFQKKGVDFDIKMWYPNQKFRIFHWPLKGKGPEYGGGAELIKVLTRDCKDLGVKLLLRTKGKGIIRGAKGNVTGVVAINSGREFEIKTRSVIIATGTFAGNIELIKKLCPDSYYEGMHTWEGNIHHTGDGLLMAEEIGAAIADRIPMSGEGPSPNYPTMKGSLAADIKEPFAGIVKEPYTVWVNKRGRRFVDETAGYMLPESGNAIMRQPDKVMYTLFDDRIRQDMEAEGLLIGRGWGRGEEEQRIALPGLEGMLRRRAEGGEDSLVKIADSWEEMANWIGAVPQVLKAEIEGYNSYCDHGYDALFAKERRFLLPLRQPPYYAIRCITSLSGTMGGIKINERMEVLDTRGNPIPGLYAAGDTASGLEAQTYCGELCGSGLGFAMNSGRIAGENAAEFVSGK